MRKWNPGSLAILSLSPSLVFREKKEPSGAEWSKQKWETNWQNPATNLEASSPIEASRYQSPKSDCILQWLAEIQFADLGSNFGTQVARRRRKHLKASNIIDYHLRSQCKSWNENWEILILRLLLFGLGILKANEGGLRNASSWSSSLRSSFTSIKLPKPNKSSTWTVRLWWARWVA